MTVPDRLRLPLHFDAAALAAELHDLPPRVWTPHFNRAIYDGDWSGVALRSVAGQASQLYPDPTAPDFADTAVLASCPRLSEALAQILCPMTSVRLLALGAGATIAEHRDFRLGFEDGEVRLHIPILTNAAVEFVLDGRPVVLGPGECWYLNLNLPHGVANRSLARRVHLVIDCVVNSWLEVQFETAMHDRLGTRTLPPQHK
ncbi:MAG: aspartyl/asparaginyl beta-hydroxylase domain-containing protein [Actinomycetota bacterium]|nr:aspartyl/asparaginyl beta-hydroxylase domain-containing protein [Actinomycetota bacterium]